MIRKAETLATTVLGCLLFSTAALGPVQAQQYIISTVAGEAPPPTPVRGVDLTIGTPVASRRIPRRTCASGEWTRFIRRLSAQPKELVLEITEQQPDGRRFERRLVLEKQ